MNGAHEQLSARDSAGAAPAPFIFDGQRYAFSLYPDSSSRHAAANASVTRG